MSVPRVLDSYVWRARIFPITLTVSPLAILILTLDPPLDAWSRAWSIVGAAVVVLASQVGRDAGKHREPALWAMWGGAPATRRLRYAGSANREATRALHTRVQRVVGQDLGLPSEMDERNDPGEADRIYEAAVAVLRTRTRDRGRFRLIYSENCDYGFRRNLYGLRTYGAWCCRVVLILSAVLIWPEWTLASHRAAVALVIPGAAAIAGLVLWRGATPAWVRLPAEAYADRLIEAVNELAP